MSYTTSPPLTETQVSKPLLFAIRKAVKDTNIKHRYYVRVCTQKQADGTWTDELLIGKTVTNGPNASEPETTFFETLPALPAKREIHSLPFATDRFVAAYSHYRSEQGLLNSLAGVLRIGDEVRIRWCIGNNTPKLSEADFTHDSAFLAIFRNRKFLCEFLVDDRVTTANGDRMADRYFHAAVAS